MGFEGVDILGGGGIVGGWATTTQEIRANKMIQIKDRYTGSIILEKETLIGANLFDANLSGTDIRKCIGNITEIKSLQCKTWMVSFTKNHHGHRLSTPPSRKNGGLSQMTK